MRKQQEVLLYGNLTAMIDVVFQIIIFFVCTANLQDTSRDTRIALAKAPNGPAAGIKDTREIVVDVNQYGGISIARTPVTKVDLTNVLKKALAESGGKLNDLPVIIRGDAKATHLMIRGAMDTCAEAGIWKIKIAALKERGR